jgi:DNA-binding transcriptional ArsR family regulator
MSDRRLSALPDRIDPAAAFAALGDPTRLTLLGKLSVDAGLSIARLTEGSALSRQAVTKHLRVLESVGMVRYERSGRESLYWLEPAPLAELRSYLERVSRQWDDALARLKAFVEE